MEHKCELNEQELKRIKNLFPKKGDMEDLSNLFKMYSDPTRLRILHVLFQKEMCVCDIAYLLGMSHSAISHQLAVLRNNRIIKTRRSGKNIFYSLNDEHIQLIYNAGYDHIREE